MTQKRTLLSAGIIIAEMLRESSEVMNKTTRVFPVVDSEATLPYVRYYRTKATITPVKSPDIAGEAVIAVECYAAEYGESVDLAEAVLGALNCRQGRSEDTGLYMRSCQLVDSAEGWADDAYKQVLFFNIKI